MWARGSSASPRQSDALAALLTSDEQLSGDLLYGAPYFACAVDPMVACIERTSSAQLWELVHPISSRGVRALVIDVRAASEPWQDLLLHRFLRALLY
jgi:hypothetical protein